MLTPRPQRWPLQFMNWAVPAEMLHDIRFLDGVMDHGGLTIEDVGLGGGATCDFLIAPARHLVPPEHDLPNGRMHLLVATAITRDQMQFGRTHGWPALLKRLIDEGPGQVSLYEDPPPAPPGPEPDNWVSYEDQASPATPGAAGATIRNLSSGPTRRACASSPGRVTSRPPAPSVSA